jgi:hypothetical protein
MPNSSESDVKQLSRIKQLRWLLGTGALAALVEGARGVGFFVVNAHWRSLSLEVLKLLLVFGTVFMTNRSGNPEGSEQPANHNLLALKVGIFAVLISLLTDQAFLQNRW